MTLEEILKDMHGLNARLQVLEQRYGLLSEDMYMLYRLGELEQSQDLIRWVGYYELRQERRHAYDGALRERLLAWRGDGHGTAMPLKAHAVAAAEG